MSSFLDEVREQGPALRTLAEHYRGPGAPHLREAAQLVAGRPLLLTGMGSSWAAALAVEASLVEKGRLAVAVEASEVLYRWLPVAGTSGFVPIIISQSGESPEILRLIERLGEKQPPVRFLAITNSPQSTLGRKAAVTFSLLAGKEEGVTNKTFLNSLAAGMLLGRSLLAGGRGGGPADGVSAEGGRRAAERPGSSTRQKIDEMGSLLEIAEILEAASGVEALIRDASGRVEGLHRVLTDPHARGATEPSGNEVEGLAGWDLIGRGSGMAVVHQGALLLRELTGRVVTPSSGGTYRHGPVYRSGPSTRAIILGCREEEGSLQARLARDMILRGGSVAFIGDFDPEIAAERFARLLLPPVAKGLFPITATIPIELLAVIDARTRGYDPGPTPKITPME